MNNSEQTVEEERGWNSTTMKNTIYKKNKADMFEKLRKDLLRRTIWNPWNNKKKICEKN